ncbi:phosphotransferase [Nesterenkonia alba]|uniref:phosphotransferase n=1 Tax=Nesterenkonia alba TaxID=515814 RepID=UPI00041678A4|nr:phosphotransferase [Nesterenkonia alba]
MQPEPWGQDPGGLPRPPHPPGSSQRRQLETHQLAYLASDEIHPVVAQALGETPEEPATSVIHLESLQHRPGAGVTGIFRVRAPGGGPVERYVGITSEPLAVDDDQTAVCASPVGVLIAWRHPADPSLPGLPAATDPHSVARIWGMGRTLTGLETISYRPLRRAVIAADFSDGSRIYLKVLRSGRAADLEARHTALLRARVPAPRLVREPVHDVLALEQGRGLPLAEHFLADGGAGIRPSSILAVLDALPASVMALPAREAWTDRLAAYASAAEAALPQCAERITALKDLILTELPRTDRGPVVPTHGDFYEANLLMDDGRVSCLLDVDSLGPGHRVDDLACFLGHLAVLPAVDARYIHATAGFDRFARAFRTTVHPRSLQLRTASVALSLVAGARDARRTGWEAAAEHRLRCAEAVVGLTRPGGDLPHWPAGL